MKREQQKVVVVSKVNMLLFIKAQEVATKTSKYVNSRAAPSLEAHHRSHGPDIGSNSRGRLITKKSSHMT